jgi:hypothetical protein
MTLFWPRSLPGGVEGRRVQRDQLALQDAAVPGAIEADGRPLVADAVPLDGAVGQGRDVGRPSQDFPAMHPEGRVRQLPAPQHVPDDLPDSVVRPGDQVVPRYPPDDLGIEQPLHARGVPGAVKGGLGVMQGIEERFRFRGHLGDRAPQRFGELRAVSGMHGDVADHSRGQQVVAAADRKPGGEGGLVGDLAGDGDEQCVIEARWPAV